MVVSQHLTHGAVFLLILSHLVIACAEGDFGDELLYDEEDGSVNLDSDQVEYIDDATCSNDPRKDNPGICGCGVPDEDADGDGVMDCVDDCPSDPEKIAVGICGCGIEDGDQDRDGLINCME